MNCIVDWGDGNIDIFNSLIDSRWDHIYATPGNYDVKVYGDYPAPLVGLTNKDKIKKIKSWGESASATDWSGAFANTSLTEIAPNFNRSLKCDGMFAGASISKIPTNFMNGVNLNENSDFSGAFSGAVISDIESYAFSNLTGTILLEGCFAGAQIETIKSNAFNNLSGTIDCYSLFASTTINTVQSLAFNNLSGMINFSSLFSSGTINTVESLTFNNFTGTSVDFNSTFAGSTVTTLQTEVFKNINTTTANFNSFAPGFTTTALPARMFSNFTAECDFELAFISTNIQSIGDEVFYNIPKVTSYAQTLSSINGLTTVGNRIFCNNTSDNVSFKQALAYNPTLTTIGNSVFGSVSGNADYEMVLNNTAITTIGTNTFGPVTGNASYDFAFDSCVSLISIPSGTFSTIGGNATFEFCFNSCESLETINSNFISNIGGNANFSFMFDGASNISLVDTSAFEITIGGNVKSEFMLSDSEVPFVINDRAFHMTVNGHADFAHMVYSNMSGVTIISIGNEIFGPVTKDMSLYQAFNNYNISTIGSNFISNVGGNLNCYQMFGDCDIQSIGSNFIGDVGKNLSVGQLFVNGSISSIGSNFIKSVGENLDISFLVDYKEEPVSIGSNFIGPVNGTTPFDSNIILGDVDFEFGNPIETAFLSDEATVDASNMFAGTEIVAIGNNLFNVVAGTLSLENSFMECSGTALYSTILFSQPIANAEFKYTFLSNYNMSNISTNMFTNIANITSFEGAFIDLPQITSAVPELWTMYPTAIGTDCFAGTSNVSNVCDIPLEWGRTGNCESPAFECENGLWVVFKEVNL